MVIDYHLVEFLDSYGQSLKNMMTLAIQKAEELGKNVRILVKVGKGEGRDAERSHYRPMLRTYCLRFLFRYRYDIDFKPY